MKRWPVLVGRLLVTASLFAQDPFTLKVDVPIVFVDVTVTDSKGVLVNNLSKADFEIDEDAVLQDIRFFSPVSAPYNVFLLFDRSASTKSKWPFMQKAVLRFIENLRPQDRIALGSFADDFDVHLHWTSDHAKAIGALNQAMNTKNDGTLFYLALDRALRREFRGVTGRRAVIVLTDGQDIPYLFENERDLKRALKSAREQRIPIYLVALRNDADAYVVLQSTRLYLERVKENMQSFADASGGQLLFPSTLDDVVPLYDQIGRALGTSYSLGYVPPGPGRRGAYRRIEVKTRINGLRVTQSRAGYVVRP